MMLLFALLACRGDIQNEGTIVGNPGDAKTKIAPGSDLNFVYGTGTFLEIMLGNDEAILEMETLDEFDLLNPTQTIEVPSGNWQQMSIYVEEVYLEGVNTLDDNSFTIILNDVFVYLDGQQSFNIGDEEYILELARPNWLTGQFLLGVAESDTGMDDTGSTSIFIDETSNEYLELFALVEEQTGLFNDLDGDGEVDSQERAEGNVAYTSSTAEELETSPSTAEEDNDESVSGTVATCGCSDTSMSVFFIPLLSLVLLWRRED